MVRANQSVPVPGEAAIKVGTGPETVACFASDNDPILNKEIKELSAAV